MDLVEKFTGSNSKGKNSKGLQINSIEMSMIKWVALIVYICLTTSDWPSNIKLDMLEAIDNIVYHTKVYNWVAHIVELLKSNWERCQELDTPIRFLSLLIWIAMMKISLVGQPEFTILRIPSMYNYNCFKIMVKVLGVPSPREIFDRWLQNVKLVFYR